MNLNLDTNLIENYTSASQKVRVLTESWVGASIYCPNCGHLKIESYPNNRPVADFYCANCKEDYELKSKKDNIGTKIVDGAYDTMIERLQSDNNPNFFFLNYNLSGNSYSIKNFLVIPKHFFVPAIIEKRKPLSLTAKRSDWTGCNILLQNIPQTGKIFYIQNGKVESKEKVLARWHKTLFLREEKEISAKGWLLDVMRCVEKLGKTDFTLDEVYAFEDELGKLHPGNKHIKDKLRQQLQVLRDKGYLDFVSRGRYHLI
jgi:type II restriction enzyme